MPIYQPGGGSGVESLGFVIPSGGRYLGFPTSAVTTTIYGSNGVTRCAPYWFPSATAIDRIGIEVTLAGEAGSVIRLGAWASHTTTGLPDALLYDFGTVPGDTTVWTPITVAVSLGPGIVWLSESVQAAPTTRPTVRSLTNLTFPHLVGNSTQQTTGMNFAYPGSSTTGALPATYPLAGSPTNSIGRIQFRTV